MSPLGCVTGRFQPVHADHLRLCEVALSTCEVVAVGITNPDPTTRRAEPTSGHRHTAEANPFTYWERLELLRAALGHVLHRVRFVPFDLARPELWSGYVPLHAVQHVGVSSPWETEKVRRLTLAGYRVVEVPGDPLARRTSTAVRAAMRAGAGWEALVLPATVEPLRRLLSGRQL